MKLLVWIVGCPTVQFGLDLPYPSLRAIQRELPLVGIHRRTPGIPASALRACWSPSPCTRLSRARTTTRPPPHSTVIGRLRACPSASRPERREGDRGWFPRSPEPIDEGGVQLNPGSLATSTPQTFLVASSPAYPFRLQSHPSQPRDGCALQTDPDPPGSSRLDAYGASRTGSSRTPSRLARRTRPVWQCQRVPALSGPLPPSPAFPGSGCPQLR